MAKEQILNSVEVDLKEKYGREVSADEVLVNALFQYCIMQAQTFIAEAKQVKPLLSDAEATNYVQIILGHILALLSNKLDDENLFPSSEEILNEYSMFWAENSGLEDGDLRQEQSRQAQMVIMEFASQLENKHTGKEGFTDSISKYTDILFVPLANELYEKIIVSVELFELKK